MKLVDLTQEFHRELKPYPAKWYPRFDVTTVMDPAADPNGTTRTFTQHHLFPHNATHIESERHFFPHGRPIAQVPLESLVGPAVVADLSHTGPLEQVTADDLQASVGDLIRPRDKLLIRTDYVNRHWGEDHFWDRAAYITPCSAQWAVDKQVSLVGLDCLTERPGDADSPVHLLLLKNGIPIAEYLRNMDQLTSRRVFLVALPILVGDVEAAAARVIAIEDIDPSFQETER